MRVATKWVKEMLNATAIKCAGHSTLLRALKKGGGHVTWCGWGHVGAGFEVANVVPGLRMIKFFFSSITTVCNFFQF